jgi:hypothetical protein
MGSGDGTTSGSCAVVVFGISGVELWHFITVELVFIYLISISCQRRN